MLVARILLIWGAPSTLTSRPYPFGSAASSAFGCLLAIGIWSWLSSSADDVVNAQPADILCDGRDDIAAKLSILAHVFSFEPELVLL